MRQSKVVRHSMNETRWKQRFANFKKSYGLLQKYATQTELTELERAGVIQLFEVTFELAWKVLKDYLAAEGFVVTSPRDAIKTAFRSGLIEDGHVWIEGLSDRNLSTHTYDESFVEEFVDRIRTMYLPAFKQLHQRFSGEEL